MRHTLFWLAVLTGCSVALYILSAMLWPFILALVLSYSLDPLVTRLERLGLPRRLAVAVLLSLFVTVLILVLVFVTPVLLRQMQGFVTSLPGYVARLQMLASEKGAAFLTNEKDGLLAALGIHESLKAMDVQKPVADLASEAINRLGDIARGLWSGSQAILGLLAFLVVTPVVTFYLLVDWSLILASVGALIPPRNRDAILDLGRQVDRSLAGFVRGQSLVCLILAFWYGIGFSLCGLNFGLLFGLAAGLLSFIPYVGSLIPCFFVLLTAIVQVWPDWTLFFLVLSVIMTGQFLEGNVLSPWLVGSSVGLHPAWMIFALLAAGNLYGLKGLLLAIPVAAILRILWQAGLQAYWHSPFYDTGGGALSGEKDASAS
jgi:predicted PurR-regulated permease PerM